MNFQYSMPGFTVDVADTDTAAAAADNDDDYDVDADDKVVYRSNLLYTECMQAFNLQSSALL